MLDVYPLERVYVPCLDKIVLPSEIAGNQGGRALLVRLVVTGFQFLAREYSRVLPSSEIVEDS